MKKILSIVIVVAILAFGGWGIYHFVTLSVSTSHSGDATDSPNTNVSKSDITLRLFINSDDIERAQDTRKLTVTVSVSASVDRIDYQIDGATVGGSVDAPHFTTTLDLRKLKAGDHILRALAYSSGSQVAQSDGFSFTLTRQHALKYSKSSSVVDSGQFLSIVASGGPTQNDKNPGNGRHPSDPTPPSNPTETWPSAPPAQVCGNHAILDGPSVAPAGAIVVPAGDNSTLGASQPGAVYWFAPGVHTLGSGEYSQIAPAKDSTYIGAPGAVIDGQHINQTAFGGSASGVTISHLTIRNFATPRDQGTINHNSGSNWTIEYTTAQNNSGGAVFAGSGAVVRYNCLKDNGQYGFQVYSAAAGGPQGVLLDHNEIVGNNTDDWETQIPGCGCSGGGKFWRANHVTVTDNYVHNNMSVGLWADTNNNDFLVQGNYIADNYSPGLEYETSYNMTVAYNTFVGNGVGAGPTNPGFPTGAIYLSESGGDSRVAARTDTINIHDNNFLNNWSGVILWENADRFCSSPANTSSESCTLVNPAANLTTCGNPADGGSINLEPYYSDCRWKTQNVRVHDNTFSIDRSSIDGCTTDNGCGYQGIFSNYGTYPSWSPYQGDVIQTAITYNQNNHFDHNTYIGDWAFKAFSQDASTNFVGWQQTPIAQDVGSTYNGKDHQSIPNILTSDSATFEGSVGDWQGWYSATVSQSSTEAHSGSHSLKVSITDPYGWALQVVPQETIAIGGGSKTISFWAKLGSISTDQFHPKLSVHWKDSSGTSLGSTVLEANPLTNSWQHMTMTVMPPSGTASASVLMTGSNGTTGDTFYVDDVRVGDAD